MDITEIMGMENEVITRAAIFERDPAGVLFPTGLIPNMLKKINSNGQIIPHSFFEVRGVVRKVG